MELKSPSGKLTQPGVTFWFLAVLITYARDGGYILLEQMLSILYYYC